MENQPQDTKIVEAEVVAAPAATVPAVVKPKRESHRFIPARFGTKNRLLSIRISKFLEAYVKTWNITDAAKEIGISPATADRYLARAEVREFLEEAKDRIAKSRDLTLDKINARITEGVDGEELTSTQIECMKMAQKMLRPSDSRTHNVNVQVNNTVNIDSPYGAIPMESMAKEFQARADAIKSESADGPRIG